MRGKNPNHVPLKLISLRLDKDVYDYLMKHHPYRMQTTIRTVLEDYIKSHGDIKNDNDTSE